MPPERGAPPSRVTKVNCVTENVGGLAPDCFATVRDNYDGSIKQWTVKVTGDLENGPWQWESMPIE